MRRLQELPEAGSSGNAERQPAGLPDSQLPRSGLRGRRGCGLLSAGETKGSQPKAPRGRTGAREVPLGSKAGLSSPRSSSRSKRTGQCFKPWESSNARRMPSVFWTNRTVCGCFSVSYRSRRKESLLKSPLRSRRRQSFTQVSSKKKAELPGASREPFPGLLESQLQLHPGI